MIIRLDQHSAAEVRAELDDEYGALVVLSLDLERHELGRWTPRKETHDAEAACNAAENLQADRDAARNLATAYEWELRRVVEMLERAGERSVDRSLLPEEARALAAMLVHFAERADAPK